MCGWVLFINLIYYKKWNLKSQYLLKYKILLINQILLKQDILKIIKEKLTLTCRIDIIEYDSIYYTI